jgi:hypothetical protein
LKLAEQSKASSIKGYPRYGHIPRKSVGLVKVPENLSRYDITQRGSMARVFFESNATMNG